MTEYAQLALPRTFRWHLLTVIFVAFIALAPDTSPAQSTVEEGSTVIEAPSVTIMRLEDGRIAVDFTGTGENPDVPREELLLYEFSDSGAISTITKPFESLLIPFF